MKFTRILFPIVLMLTTSCKFPGFQKAKVQSLDNMARNESTSLRLNDCHIDELKENTKTNPIIESFLEFGQSVTEDQKNQINAAFNIMAQKLPNQMFDIIQKTFGAKIKVQNEVPDQCRNQNKTSVVDKFVSEGLDGGGIACWHSEKGKTPVIYIYGNTISGTSISLLQSFNHNFLRMSFYLYVQYSDLYLDFLKDLYGAKAPEEDRKALDAAIENSKEVKAAIAKSFIEDVTALDPARGKVLEEQKKTDEKSFSDLVMAEALDSYFCSTKDRLLENKALDPLSNTRGTLEKSYPKTFEITKAVVEKIKSTETKK